MRIRLVLLGVAGALALAGCGSSSRPDATVASDLRSLLDRNSVSYITVGPCIHQSGDQYICSLFTPDLSSDSAAVTDDGHSIYEQPIPK